LPTVYPPHPALNGSGLRTQAADHVREPACSVVTDDEGDDRLIHGGRP
jgi:hypothetical protein